MMNGRTADNDRRQSGMIRLATVETVDRATGRVELRLGEDSVAGPVLSGPVPWFTGAAGARSRWAAPSEGEQGIVLCPEGDIAQAVFLPGVYSDANPARADDRSDRADYDDGAIVAYDPETHTLRATLPASGRVEITAPGGFHLVGDVTLTGKLTATGDVKAGSISLQGHKHTGVDPGAGVSGAPQP